MKAVKFLLAHTIGTQYRPDEVATFSDSVADELVALKIAEPHKLEGKQKPETVPSPTDAERAAAAEAAARSLAQKEKDALSNASDTDLDKIILDEKIEGVAADAVREDKIAAIIAARTPKLDEGKADLKKLTVAALDKIIADEKIEGVASDANKGDKIDAIIAARSA